MKKIISLFAVLAIAGAGFFFSRPVKAASLSQTQISSIMSLLEAFGVDQTTLLNVYAALNNSSTTVTQTASTTASGAPTITNVFITQAPVTPPAPVVPPTPSLPQPFIKWMGKDFISNGTSCTVTPLNQEIYTPPNGNPCSNPIILSTTTSGSVSLVAPLSPAGRSTMYLTLYPDGLHLTTSSNAENIRNQYGEINNDFSLDPSNPRFLYTLNTNDPNAYSLFTISCSVNGMTTTTKVRQNCVDNNGTGGCLTQ
jgi:hypothetical protein